jgi:hypothetical protein
MPFAPPLLLLKSATYAVEPSGLTAMPNGLFPALIRGPAVSAGTVIGVTEFELVESPTINASHDDAAAEPGASNVNPATTATATQRVPCARIPTHPIDSRVERANLVRGR